MYSDLYFLCTLPSLGIAGIFHGQGIAQGMVRGVVRTQKDAAKAFTEYLKNKDAQDILTKYGFTLYSDSITSATPSTSK